MRDQQPPLNSSCRSRQARLALAYTARPTSTGSGIRPNRAPVAEPPWPRGRWRTRCRRPGCSDDARACRTRPPGRPDPGRPRRKPLCSMSHAAGSRPGPSQAGQRRGARPGRRARPRQHRVGEERPNAPRVVVSSVDHPLAATQRHGRWARRRNRHQGAAPEGRGQPG